MEPRADCELEDEELAGLGEENGGLGRYHADVLIRLHDLLDASQWELVILKVVDLFNVVALVVPEHLQLLLLLLEEMMKWRGRD